MDDTAATDTAATPGHSLSQSVSFIPVPVKRSSVQSVRSSTGPGSPVMRGHRRRTSAMSARSHTSGDEGSIRTPLSVASGYSHRRMQDSISDVGSPLVDNGAFAHFDVDAYGAAEFDDMERVRAMTLSTLSKPQRPRALPNAPRPTSRSSGSFDVRRRTGTSVSSPVTPMSAVPLSLQETPLSRADKRMSLSRIPRSTVTHAVSQYNYAITRAGGVSPTLSEEYLETLTTNTPSRPDGETPRSPNSRRRAPTTSRPHPTSPTTGRLSLGASGKSSKMIDALQTELEQTKAHLDRAKAEVRACHHEIGTLTSRTEDLRETRDRMRTEADALNNVINRKERMVTDVLARARTAEATVQQYTTERQEFEQRSKEVEAEARERVEKEFMARVKAEAEAEALRDSVRSLRAVWQREVEAYRNEVSRMADQMRAERETAGVKRDEVMALVNKQTDEHKHVVTLVDEVNAKHAAASSRFEAEVRDMRAQVDAHAQDADNSRRIARALALELIKLRRAAEQYDRPDLHAVVQQIAAMGTDLDDIGAGIDVANESTEVDEGLVLSTGTSNRSAAAA
ncbi:uncharacterized protein EHS24_001177 [Apiotrichum porosum]|uniref:SWI5-dependent HO expression protein 3 n=1 Tax=Apiotrichum porosum TaxID=105984 RepID=A0A427XJR5_9TREE|nr:uncharacterized protein EHS24_001177 [Apiotrichum porosum]RSH79139.1 hypothetical protein EHS24_001177 [Apiotrichum porosum]